MAVISKPAFCNDSSLWEVKRVFSRLIVTMAKGPDNLSPRVLKERAKDLADIFQ